MCPTDFQTFHKYLLFLTAASHTFFREFNVSFDFVHTDIDYNVLKSFSEVIEVRILLQKELQPRVQLNCLLTRTIKQRKDNTSPFLVVLTYNEKKQSKLWNFTIKFIDFPSLRKIGILMLCFQRMEFIPCGPSMRFYESDNPLGK